MSSGGYRETALDRAAAAGYAQQGAMAQRIWEDYGRPEADRWMRAKAQVGAFNPSILSFIQNPRRYQQPAGGLTLAAAPPPSQNTNTYRFGTPSSPTPPSPAPPPATPAPPPVAPPVAPPAPPPVTQAPASVTPPPGHAGLQESGPVRWEDIRTTVNTWKLRGVPVYWGSPESMYQSMQNQAWLAQYGADLQKELERNPRVRDYLVYNAPPAVLNNLGIQSPVAPPAPPPASPAQPVAPPSPAPPPASPAPPVTPPGAQVPAPVRWDDIKSTINSWKLAGVPVSWETPGAMYQSMQDPAWLARYGADLQKELERNPRVRDFFAQNAPRDVLGYLGVEPQAAPPTVSMPPMNVDLSYWGFGQRLEAPDLNVVNPDWSALPRSIDPNNSFWLHSFQTSINNLDSLGSPVGNSFNPLIPAGNLWATTPAEASVAPRTAQPWVDTPDASEAGRAFADALNAANLLRVNEAALARKQDAAGALARRGVGASALGDASDRAVELWANREAAKLQADTAAQRLALEQALRNERNQQLQQRFANEMAVMAMEQALREENDRRLIQKAQLGQQLTAAENARLQQIWENEMRRVQARADLTARENERNLQTVMTQSELQQRALNDFIRKIDTQRALAADRNQAALMRAGWEAQQNQQRQNELMGLLNYLQADATGQLNPWMGVSALGEYARGMADLAGQQAARAQAAQQGAWGLWGSALQALGSLGPWFRR